MTGRIFTVAIDGPAASGKGTIARAVAGHFGFAHLDTGLLYRALAAKTLTEGLPLAQAARIASDLGPSDLDAPDLRTAKISEAASQVAAQADVRAALLDWQRGFSRRDGGAVLDGRDIGTVVCPNADVKLFVTANEHVRAKRRFAELSNTTFDRVLSDVRARDKRDAERDIAPMKPAADALLIDTSKLSIDAAVTEAVAKIKNVLEGRD